MASRDINQVILLGRLTRDPELSYTQNQTPVCKFAIANNRLGANGQSEVSFFDIVTWSKIATTCAQYLKKGSQVALDGRLQQSRYQDKQGQNKSRVEIVASMVQFLGGRGETGGGGSSSDQSSTTAPETKNPGDQTSGSSNIEFKEFDQESLGDDEVPF